jgi:HlyD family secretion protein
MTPSLGSKLLRPQPEPAALDPKPRQFAPPSERERTSPPKRNLPRRRSSLRRWQWALVLALFAAVGLGGLALRHRDAGEAQYVTAPVSRGEITRVTVASGMVNPVETVQIGSYVSGRIQDLYCDYNSEVVKNQPCAKIDPRSYQATVDQSAAAVDTAKAQLAKDQAQLAYAKVTYDRNIKLLGHDVVSHDAADKALNGYKQTEAQVALDQATIAQREAELKAAQVNLDYTDIVSPVDGTVVSRSVAIGQTVAASFQTPTLFLIAKDLKKMQVEANVSEAEIGEIREGEDASFTVEAFPGRTFTGEVTQIRQAPVAVQNVISYDVVIAADNHDLALKPGMTATAHIVTAQRHHVREIPQAALRFTPDGHAVEQAAAGESKHGQVWVRRGAALEAVPVELGLADENNVEVTGGALSPGDEVVTARAGQGAQAAAPDQP